MNYSSSSLRGACLTLGLLLSLGGVARAQCPTPVFGTTPIPFGSALGGGPGGLSFSFTLPGSTSAQIIGGNFTLTANTCPSTPTTTPCSITVQFTPSALACETVPGTLLISDAATGCPLLVIPLQGTACSFTCAIAFAGNLPGLTASGRAVIINQLSLASATTSAATRCAALNCALCIAQGEVALGGATRVASANRIIAQIQCLQAFLGCL